MTLGTAAIRSTIATSADRIHFGATSVMNNDVASEIGKAIATAMTAIEIVNPITAATPNTPVLGCHCDVVKNDSPVRRKAGIDLTAKNMPTADIVASTINPLVSISPLKMRSPVPGCASISRGVGAS